MSTLAHGQVQYQDRAEPVALTAGEPLTTMAMWFVRPPDRPPARIPARIGWLIPEAIEPTSYVIPDPTWHREPNLPQWSKAPLRIQFEVALTEPTLFVVPDFPTWTPLPNLPRWFPRPLVPEGRYVPQAIEPTSYVVPDFPTWSPLPNLPRWSRQPIVPEGWAHEPILASFVEVLQVEKWWQPASQRLHRTRPNVREGHSVSIVNPSLFVTPGGVAALEWHPSTNQRPRGLPPLRLQFEVDITETTWSHPPFIQTAEQRPWPRLRLRQQFSAEILNPALIVAPQVAAFMQQPVEQPRIKPPIRKQWETAVSEPTLMVVPAMATWFVRPNEPVRVKAPLPLQQHERYITEPSLFVTPAFPEWWEPASEPRRRPAPLRNQFEAAITEPTSFFDPQFAGWWRQTSEPLFAEAPLRRQFEAVNLEPVIYVWQQHTQPNQPSWSKRRLLEHVYLIRPQDVVQTPDGWQAQQQVPTPAERSRLTETIVTVVESRRDETVTLDKWYRQTVSLPTGKPRPSAEGFAIAITITEPSLYVVPSLGSWHRPASEPIRELARQGSEGVSVLVAAPVIFVWQDSIAMDVRPTPRRRQAIVPAAVQVFVLDVRSDSWRGEQPDFARVQRQAATGRAVVEPYSDEVATVRRWWVQAAEPVRRAAQRILAGLIEPLIVTAFDAPPAVQSPASPPARRQTLAAEEILASVLLVEPRFDSWFVRPADPVRSPRRLVAEGTIRDLTEPTLFVVPSVSTWYVQHPTRPAARHLPVAAMRWYTRPELPLLDILSLCVDAATIRVPWIDQSLVSVGFVDQGTVRAPWIDAGQGGCPK